MGIIITSMAGRVVSAVVRWGLPVLRRAGTLVALVIVACLLPRLLPGDPVTALWTQGSADYVFDDQIRASLLNRYGLDRPLLQQVATEALGLLRGEAGTSIRYGEPVAGLIADRLPRTLLLIAAALAMGIAIGVPVGAHAGWRRGGVLDVAGLVASAVLRAVPAFFLAAVALYLLSVRLRWFPLSGHAAASASSGAALMRVLDALHHLALPAMVLAVPVATGQFLLTRAAVLGEVGAGYLLAARTRGARGRQLLHWHVLPNAAAPILALTGVQASAVAGGVLVVESVYAYPGFGSLMVSGIAHRDYPVLQASCFWLSAVVVAAGLVADLCLRVVDRRAGRT